MSTPPVISTATGDDLDDVRGLLHEYAAWLGIDLGFQQFAREVAELPGDYAPPDGTLLLARVGSVAAGMVALRKIAPERCEMKRLYVRPLARGTGLGRALAGRIISAARARDYREMWLDTLPVMQDAQRLYVELGFRDIPPYYDSPVAGTRYMALSL